MGAPTSPNLYIISNKGLENFSLRNSETQKMHTANALLLHTNFRVCLKNIREGGRTQWSIIISPSKSAKTKAEKLWMLSKIKKKIFTHFILHGRMGINHSFVPLHFIWDITQISKSS